MTRSVMQDVKPFVGMLSKEKQLFDEIKKRLEEFLGPTDAESPVWEWAHTDYYEKEMGKGLKRKFIFFFNLINPEILPDIKIKTTELEIEYTVNEKRRINLDPGYIHPAKVVLSTRKDYSHRIYLKDGVYGEVTLHYHDRSFRPFPHTYPDFKSKEYIELFNKIRRGLVNKG
ncbi:MAG: DUF4416 family protein [Nitrospirae bacterium]|nr:DUF4416 family protein [Nitrospirota bacterium]